MAALAGILSDEAMLSELIAAETAAEVHAILGRVA